MTPTDCAYRLSACLSVCLSARLPVCLFARLLVCLFARLLVCLFAFSSGVTHVCVCVCVSYLVVWSLVVENSGTAHARVGNSFCAALGDARRVNG